jgi:membrane-bound serine protease (ClpP class)
MNRISVKYRAKNRSIASNGFYCFLVFLSVFLNVSVPADESANVWVIDIKGAIGPATSDYVLRGFEAAETASAKVIVLQIDTPGGLDTAMRDIIKAILASKTPIVSFVGPKGSRAASAGTYISYASHIAAMAPATNLGAATPVQIAAPSMPSAPTEDDDAKAAPATAMEKKMVNDATAYIRGLAELRGRNAEWAELAVREAASLDSEEALEQQVIDIVAENLADLMSQINGRTIEVEGGEVTIELAEANLHFHEPDWRTEILSIITNPSMVLVLGMIGMYGVILEFYSPGSLIPGIIGVICLLLAGYAVQLLPLNYAGLALLALGIGLIVAEAMVPSFGILGIGGIIAFSIGGLMLFDTEMEAFQVGLPTIAATAMVSAALIFATVNIAMKIRKQRVSTGENLLLGATGQALNDFGKEGQVRVGSEIWRAYCSEKVVKGDVISVESVEGLRLRVKKTGEDKGE